MILSFHPCFDADSQIILGSRPLNSNHLKLIRKAEAIILPQALQAEIYRACTESGALLFPNYEMRFRYPGKIGQSLMFRDFGFPHPETFRWNKLEDFKKKHLSTETFPHKKPFLIKDDRTHEAEGVYLVKDKHSLSEALLDLEVKKRSGSSGFITQDYVSSNGNILRAVIIGKKIMTYWKRPNRQGQVITTISRGAVIDHHWRPDLQAKAEGQARSLSKKTRINVAAIDFVFDLSEKKPEPLFLEINYYFGRKGLGGTEKYYLLFYQAVQDWLKKAGLNLKSVRIV
jgi:ribosomal protein S6--L-glutamate ligase